MSSPGFLDVLLALSLIALSVAISRWWKVPIQKELSLGAIRAFVQLVAVGYALEYIFDLQSALLMLAAMLVMLVIGAFEASRKLEGLRRPFVITLVAMGLGWMITLGLMLVIGLIEFDARYVIPLAGMIISNSMNAATLTIRRITTDLTDHRSAVESALALGLTWREASRKYQREAVIAGMVSMLNFLKTVGVVALPGAMTGMILAGAEPLEAVLLQLIVGYMLVSSVTITSIATLELTIRRFFTPAHQYRSFDKV